MNGISSQYQKLTSDNLGAQVLTWQVLNPKTNQFQDILYTGSSAKRSGIPLLFPFANPLKDEVFVPTGKKIGQHGFARNCEWRLTKSHKTGIVYSLSNYEIPEQMQAAYPYNFELELSLNLKGENKLEYVLDIHNNDDAELPIAPGLHPYFPIKHDHKRDLTVTGLDQFEATKIDWNSKLDGDFFELNQAASINFPDKAITIDTADSEINFEYLVVWSQNQQDQDHDFVCIEPFSRITNAINDSPILIAPHSSKKMVVSFVAKF